MYDITGRHIFGGGVEAFSFCVITSNVIIKHITAYLQ